ncbi:hypothetical protein VTN00DRAFT_10373 [Thermoascus crustaceus]|uniref:uncharacterized protein n=1 Tax=Thermoascus crustaceus TaxID=5088 RepID=UPI003742D664
MSSSPFVDNPFAKREAYGRNSLVAYRILVPLSWVLVLVVGIYYSVHKPDDIENGHRLWKQGDKHITPFSQSAIVTGIYWILLLLSQLNYVAHLFSQDIALVNAASTVASHFILNNLFVFAWILLWVRNHFWGAEVILAANFLSQSTAYWVHRPLPAFVHFPAVAGPYAWTLTALFWNGAVAVGSNSLPARIVANVFIWVLFVVGYFHILVNQDYILGYSLSFLTLSLALKQFAIKIIALQWIFAFTIFAVFFVGSLYISTTKYANRDVLFRRIVEPEATDRERQPLLDDH